MNQPTRQTLLQKIRDAHDEKSWREFVEIYRPYIYVVMKNLGVKHDEIEDHFQSVLLICWQKLPDFHYNSEKGGFRYWLSRIANYTVSNHLRKFSRRSELGDTLDIPHSIPAEIEEMSIREWKIFLSKMAWANIKGELSKNAILSFEGLMAGKKPADIAESLQIPVNSVNVNKKRIEKKMFKEIQNLQRELD